MSDDSILHLFLWSAGAVALYAVAVRGSLKLAMPIKERLVGVAERLKDAGLTNEQEDDVAITLSLLDSRIAPWLFALLVTPAAIITIWKHVSGEPGARTPIDDCPHKELVKEFVSLTVPAIVLNSPLAAILFAVQVLIVSAVVKPLSLFVQVLKGVDTVVSRHRSRAA